VIITSVYGNDNDIPRGSTCFQTVHDNTHESIREHFIAAVQGLWNAFFFACSLFKSAVINWDERQVFWYSWIMNWGRNGRDQPWWSNVKQSARLVSVLSRFEPRNVRIRIGSSQSTCSAQLPERI
jgi:hypothetical protein